MSEYRIQIEEQKQRIQWAHRPLSRRLLCRSPLVISAVAPKSFWTLSDSLIRCIRSKVRETLNLLIIAQGHIVRLVYHGLIRAGHSGRRLHAAPSAPVVITKRQLWKYSGLGLETHDSAQYHAVEGELRRSKRPATVRGLNKDHNHDLKDIFKGAAMRASTAAGPLRDFYENLLAKGRKPTMARLTLARKIAAIMLIVWKKEVRFDANYLKPQQAA